MFKGFIFYLSINLFLLLLLPFLVLSSDFLKVGEEPLFRLYLHKEGGVMEIPLEEYLRGVVAGEMPASFPMEALKAQAVVSRTYALSRYYAISDEKVHITTDPSRHQAWYSSIELLRRWGSDFFSHYQRITDAIHATRGEVLIYGEDLIEAVYHANAGGMTEDSLYIWHTSLPYLKSRESPWDFEAPRVYQSFYFSLQELERRFSTPLSSTQDLQVLTKSPSGRVQEIQVGEKTLRGVDFRSRLNLPSTLMEIEREEEGIFIKTSGAGHGVGMSQYGAQGMAREGYSYQEILEYFYQGVTLVRMGY